MSDQWQDNLRNRMKLYEEPAPEGLWKSIEGYIDIDNKVQVMPVIKKQRIWGFSIAAVAAVAIILLLIVWHNSSNKQGATEYVEESLKSLTPEKTKESERVVESKRNIELERAVGTENILIAEKISEIGKVESRGKVLEKGDVQTKEDVLLKGEVQLKGDVLLKGDFLGKSEYAVKEIVSDKAIVDNKEVLEKKRIEEIGDALKVDRTVGSDKNVENKDQLLAMSTQISSQKQSKWQTSISTSNMPSESSESNFGYRTFALGEIVEEQYDFISKYAEPEVYTNVEHSQPITVGLTLRYNLNDKWSVGSGLNYSLLKSRLRSESNNYYYDDRQTLHYIGLPLSVSYSFWQNDKISTYISSGGQLEKNVAGRLNSNFYIDNQLELKDSRKVTAKELQWSVNSSIGVEYRVSNTFGLYAEPGVSYYFKNKSDLETIYKDRPFIFNLRLGLRFTLNN